MGAPAYESARPRPNASESRCTECARQVDDGALDEAMATARDALLQGAERAGLLAVRTRGGLHDSGRVHPDDALSRRDRCALERKLAVYLRSRQAAHDGWPLYHGGDFNLSCSVKAYYALKLAGDDPKAPHMLRARKAILKHGGAARANVFTRIALALFGQIPWRGVPYIPVEIMLLPRWFPFHIDKVSYWSRAVMVPLFILCTRKPLAKNPRHVHIRELFVTAPEHERHYFRDSLERGGWLPRIFLLLDRFGRLIDPLIPRACASAQPAAPNSGCSID
jgi:squalene-hopene/tetraprenyl-beta-curcumene cyclase